MFTKSAILLLSFCWVCSTGAQDAATIVSVEKIWDRAPHNAFTDLTRYQDNWYCVFREGTGHVSPDGALRIITSPDGTHWKSAGLFNSSNSDLRDAKITVTPDGSLMLSGAEAMHQPSPYKHQSLVWLSPDGKRWNKRVPIGDKDYWMWRTTWHNDRAYSFGYGTTEANRRIRLYVSDDGKSFETLVENAFDEGYPNETAMVFLPDDTCYCLLRRDGSSSTAQLGTSNPPYTQWDWKDLGVRIGGPQLIQLPDGRFVATVRLYDGRARTSLCWVDPNTPALTEFLELPSGGDTSYAGMVWHDELLWISYYSSHEGKTSIYLAKVKFAK